MSAFLSKVHYQLYDKIQYQQYLGQRLCTLLQQEKQDVEAQANLILPEGELADVIVHEQIHGWLQQSIITMEKRFAYFMNAVNKAQLVDKAKTLFFSEGEKASEQKQVHSALVAFQQLQMYMLDGMPCDHGIAIIEKDETKVVFETNTSVHTAISDLALYMQLRLAWMQGFLANHHFTVSLTDNNTFTISKEVTHE